MAVLVHCVFLAICVLGARAVVSGLTSGQQFKDTQFVEITCDQAAGAFIVTFFNGFSTPQTFLLTSRCEGIKDPLVPFPTSINNVPGRTNGIGYLYGPATSSKSDLSIFGAQCQIQLALTQSGTNDLVTTQVIRSAPAVCGPFQAGRCDCGFINLPCYWNNCDPAISAVFWWIVMLGILVLALLLYFFVKSRDLDHAAAIHDHFHGQMVLSRNTDLQKKVDALSQKVRDGTMTTERLKTSLNAANIALQDPQFLDLRRLEYLHAGKKYNGLDTDQVGVDMGGAVEMATYAHSEISYAPKTDKYVDAYSQNMHMGGPLRRRGGGF